MGDYDGRRSGKVRKRSMATKIEEEEKRRGFRFR